MLQITPHFQQSLQDFLIGLAFLSQSVMLILAIWPIICFSYLTSRSKYEVGIGVIYIRERPITTKKRLAEFLPFLPPIVKNLLAHFVRIHSTKLQLLDKECFQNVLYITICRKNILQWVPSYALHKIFQYNPACVQRDQARSSEAQEQTPHTICDSTAKSKYEKREKEDVLHRYDQDYTRHGWPPPLEWVEYIW